MGILIDISQKFSKTEQGHRPAVIVVSEVHDEQEEQDVTYE